MGRITGDLKERTLRFSEVVMSAIAELPNETRGWIVGKQLGRSATSIGANVWESDAALTDSDFAHKISIARKEASETRYWLELVGRLHMLPSEVLGSFISEADELGRVLGAIVRKTQEHVRQPRE